MPRQASLAALFGEVPWCAPVEARGPTIAKADRRKDSEAGILQLVRCLGRLVSVALFLGRCRNSLPSLGAAPVLTLQAGVVEVWEEIHGCGAKLVEALAGLLFRVYPLDWKEQTAAWDCRGRSDAALIIGAAMV